MIKIVLLICQFTSAGFLYSQHEITLKHKIKPRLMQQLDLEREYAITTIDTTYYARILYSKDSSIIIEREIHGKDSTTRHMWINGKDSLMVSWPLVKDTTTLPFNKIMQIETASIKSSSWLEPFLWMGPFAILGVGLLPVAAIDDGTDGVRHWAIFEGILAGSWGIAIFVLSRKIRYDLENEWTIQTK